MRGAGGRGNIIKMCPMKKMNKKEIMKFTLTKKDISV